MVGARLVLVTSALLLLCWPATALGRPGDVDPSFGVAGEAFVGFEGNAAHFGRMALQRDGSIVATATPVPKESTVQPPPRLVRLTPGGLLDRSFGKGGVAALPLYQVLAEPVVQDDGRIVVVGTQEVRSAAGAYDWRLAAVRLQPDGDRDPTFGTAGVAVPPNGARFTGFAAIEQADGRLVVAGGVGGDARDAFAVLRLRRDGSPDPSFGDGGLVVTPNGEDYGGALSVVERPGGRLVVGGPSGRRVREPLASYSDDDWVLRQYTASGKVDTAFGSGGITRVELEDFWVSYFDRLLPVDGGFVGVGSSGRQAIAPTHFSLGRFDSNGRLDTAFGQGGLLHHQVVPDAGGPPNLSKMGDATAQRDGKILVGGGFSAYSPTGAPARASGWAVTRHRPDGSLDTGFGDGGSATSARGLFEAVSGLEIQPGGRIVAGGTSTNCGRPVFTVVRYLADEGPDLGPAVRSCAGTVTIEPDGDLPIPIQCPFVEEVCNGEVTIEIPSLDLPVGKRKFKLGGGARGTSAVRAKGKALKLLRKPGTRRVVATFVARDAERHRRVTRRSMKVRAKR